MVLPTEVKGAGTTTYGRRGGGQAQAQRVLDQ